MKCSLPTVRRCRRGSAPSVPALVDREKPDAFGIMPSLSGGGAGALAAVLNNPFNRLFRSRRSGAKNEAYPTLTSLDRPL
jgi:hypothetical protein